MEFSSGYLVIQNAVGHHGSDAAFLLLACLFLNSELRIIPDRYIGSLCKCEFQIMIPLFFPLASYIVVEDWDTPGARRQYDANCLASLNLLMSPIS